MRIAERQDRSRRISCMFRCVAAATPACSLRSTQATTQVVPETAPTRCFSSVRDWQHPQSPCRSALCLLAPPLRSRRSPKFPNPQPQSSLLLLLRFCIHHLGTLVPAATLASPYWAPPEPCYFDVPGDAPSTLADFAGAVQDSRGLRRLGDSGCDHRRRQTPTHRREEGRGQRVLRQRTRLAVVVTGGPSTWFSSSWGLIVSSSIFCPPVIPPPAKSATQPPL
jgi:hypothetical protein